MTIEEATRKIKQDGIIAIIRGDYPLPRILDTGDALLAGGVTIVEVTLNSPGCLDAIPRLRERFAGRLLVGAGTVRTAEQWDAATGAGAQFTVAPNFNLATVSRALTENSLHVPGVFTATEAQDAFAAGCRMLKLFPSDVVGPAYLKALRAPLNDVDFVPTGGVSDTTLGAFVRAGAVAVGVGSALVAGANQSLDDITDRARRLRAAWEEAHA
ncbi:MAG: bifunctional 4-hydroxy-2-oxoglutarate aldolase/2-dehydro-3-deoxy-phosphogluconate aldolase [Anaerolineae bacterium]